MARATVALDESLLRTLESRAAAQGTSLSELVDQLIRRALHERPAPNSQDLAGRWRTFACGAPRVSVSDREALFSAMDRDA